MAWRSGDGKLFRDRAEELRARADTFSPENRKMLLNMAEYYEGFAREADRQFSPSDLVVGLEDSARRY